MSPEWHQNALQSIRKRYTNSESPEEILPPPRPDCGETDEEEARLAFWPARQVTHLLS